MNQGEDAVGAFFLLESLTVDVDLQGPRQDLFPPDPIPGRRTPGLEMFEPFVNVPLERDVNELLHAGVLEELADFETDGLRRPEPAPVQAQPKLRQRVLGLIQMPGS